MSGGCSQSYAATVISAAKVSLIHRSHDTISYIDFVKNVYYIMFVIYSTVKLQILINF